MRAITRAVSRRIVDCQLTHVARHPIDLDRARAQHTEYEAALRALGVEVLQLPEEPDLPDAVFVEDTAIVLDDVAVLMRPGAPSRRPEVPTVAAALAPWRPLLAMQGPGTVDGGDVLRLGRTLWVGETTRSTPDGIAELAALVAPHGYAVRSTRVRGALHLKSAATEVADGLLLANPAWIDPSSLGDYEWIAVDPAEPFAANAVRVAGAVIHSTQFPATQARLRARGLRVVGVDASELAKAEGGVTCCSLLVS